MQFEQRWKDTRAAWHLMHTRGLERMGYGSEDEAAKFLANADWAWLEAEAALELEASEEAAIDETISKAGPPQPEGNVTVAPRIHLEWICPNCKHSNSDQISQKFCGGAVFSKAPESVLCSKCVHLFNPSLEQ